MSMKCQVQVKLAPNAVFFYGDTKATAMKHYDEYTILPVMQLLCFDGKDAAEELFDLTNNPSRQEERIRTYGNGKSISVGDIVNVDGVDFLCMSAGWEEL